jgi:glucose-1-phosphate thymidylyltransferase
LREHIGGIAEFLEDGKEFGVDITYKVQKNAGGIAQALSLADEFCGGDDLFAVILGDNVFGTLPEELRNITSPCLFTKSVPDPQRFGVFDGSHIEEKPSNPKTDKAVVGLYIYPNSVFEYIKGLKPSARGELEITDINNKLLESFGINVVDLEKTFWSDAGTPESLKRTIDFIWENQMY